MYRTIPIACLLLLVACGHRDIDALKFDAKKYRCQQNGFCLFATGKYSLQAAFREGDAEVRADVVDAQTQRRWSQQNFAVLVSDQHANPLMVSDSGRIPPSWRVHHQTCQAVEDTAQFSQEFKLREKLLVRLAQSLHDRGHAKVIGRQDAYVLALETLQDLVEQNENYHQGHPERPPKRWKKDLLGQLGYFRHSVSPLAYHNHDSHDLDEALAVAKTKSAGRNDATYQQVLQELHPRISGEEVNGYPADKSEFIQLPHLEFRQIIFLWRKPAPTMMRIYPFEGAEHSAFAITVSYRGFETGHTWRPFLATKTRNHGTEAGANGMQLYETCSSYPVTRGYCAWKGECGGIWGLDHVCNDDTALQLYHGAGNWAGGLSCPITHRKFAPHCEALWQRDGTLVSGRRERQEYAF